MAHAILIMNQAEDVGLGTMRGKPRTCAEIADVHTSGVEERTGDAKIGSD